MLGTPSIQPGALPGAPHGGHDKGAVSGDGAADAFALLLADAVVPAADARSLTGVIKAGSGVAQDAIGTCEDAGPDADDDADAAEGQADVIGDLADLLAAAQALPPASTLTTPVPTRTALSNTEWEPATEAVTSAHAHDLPQPSLALTADAHAGAKGEALRQQQGRPFPDAGVGTTIAAMSASIGAGDAQDAFDDAASTRPLPAATDGLPRSDDGTTAPTTPDVGAASSARPLTTGARAAAEAMRSADFPPPAEPEDRIEAPSPGPSWSAATAPAGSRQAIAAAPAAPAAPAFAAQLSAAIDSPGFAPALGVQVAMLAHNGIAEARLQIHPAQWGPIAVQIELDGRSAQVNLSAEHGFTRQALEQAMPALASALGDAGFTLTGGGVFQQPRESRPPALPARPGARGAPSLVAGDEAQAIVPLRARLQQGAVDLYA